MSTEEEPVEQIDGEEESDDFDSWFDSANEKDEADEQTDESEADDEEEEPEFEPDEFRSEFASEAGLEDPAAEPEADSDDSLSDADLDLLIAQRTDGIEEMSQEEAEAELQRQRVEQFAKEALAYAKAQKAEQEAKVAAAAKALSSDAQPAEKAYEPNAFDLMDEQQFAKFVQMRDERADRLVDYPGLPSEAVEDLFASLVSAPRFPEEDE